MKRFCNTIGVAVLTGLKKAWKLSLKISRILIPVYVIVEIMDYSGIMNLIGTYLKPVMGIFGLPGEAAVPFVLANGINIYAALGALNALDNVTLGVREITILGAMIGICHTLPVETSVLKGLKVPRYLQILLRLGLAVAVGFLMNLLWRV